MTDLAAALATKLAALWRASRPVILERIDVLRITHQILVANPDDAEARTRAREAAHKLSGILGTFGLPHGSEIAAALEHRLQSDQPLTAADLAANSEQIETLAAIIASKGEG